MRDWAGTCPFQWPASMEGHGMEKPVNASLALEEIGASTGPQYARMEAPGMGSSVCAPTSIRGRSARKWCRALRWVSKTAWPSLPNTWAQPPCWAPIQAPSWLGIWALPGATILPSGKNIKTLKMNKSRRYSFGTKHKFSIEFYHNMQLKYIIIWWSRIQKVYRAP